MGHPDLYSVRRALEDVDAEHPPDKQQGDDGEDDVADPLGWGLWFS
jgi:hypothetical protein